jgi:hypothetical protein
VGGDNYGDGVGGDNYTHTNNRHDREEEYHLSQLVVTYRPECSMQIMLEIWSLCPVNLWTIAWVRVNPRPTAAAAA